MADEYCSDRKLHDLLAKHGTVDICEGISDAVGEFSHDSGINEISSRKEVIDKKGANSPRREIWSLIRSKWLDGNTSVRGLNLGMRTMQGLRTSFSFIRVTCKSITKFV